MTATNQPTKTTHVLTGVTDPSRLERHVEFRDLNPYAYQRAKAQFFTASDIAAASNPPAIIGTPQEKVIELREAVRVLATLIDMHVPKGRQRSLALTALEDVQMRANRGIFAPADGDTEPTPTPTREQNLRAVDHSIAHPEDSVPRSIRQRGVTGPGSARRSDLAREEASRRHLSPDERLQRDLQEPRPEFSQDHPREH